VRAYHHLKENNEERRCWVVARSIVERGPDNEPLLAGVTTIGRISESVLDDCERRSTAASRRGDQADRDGAPPWHAGL
jgi:hypothetical protein